MTRIAAMFYHNILENSQGRMLSVALYASFVLLSVRCCYHGIQNNLGRRICLSICVIGGGRRNALGDSLGYTRNLAWTEVVENKKKWRTNVGKKRYIYMYNNNIK